MMNEQNEPLTPRPHRQDEQGGEYVRVADYDSVCAENTILRGIAARIMPCHYCGVDDMTMCPHGFPGCGLMDDLMATEEFGVEEIRKLRAELATLKQQAAQAQMIVDDYPVVKAERDDYQKRAMSEEFLSQGKDDIYDLFVDVRDRFDGTEYMQGKKDGLRSALALIGYPELTAYNRDGAMPGSYNREWQRAEVAEQRATEAERWKNFISEYIEWAVATFPSGTTKSATRHLQREVDELWLSGESEEVADCLMLLLFISNKMGIDILAEARKKFEINKRRQWANPDADGIAYHIKDSPTRGTEAK